MTNENEVYQSPEETINEAITLLMNIGNNNATEAAIALQEILESHNIIPKAKFSVGDVVEYYQEGHLFNIIKIDEYNFIQKQYKYLLRKESDYIPFYAWECDLTGEEEE
jgi:hypothetical protein